MSGWTDEKIVTLKTMWATNKSASVIGAELGFSRNAIIGKARRLRLEERPQNHAAHRAPRARSNIQRPPAMPRPKQTHQEAPMFECEPIPDTVEDRTDAACSIFELTPESCRWPCGDPASHDLYFCGRPKKEGPYCPGHSTIAFMSVHSRNR